MKNALFLRLTNEPDKAAALEAAVTNEAHPLRFQTDAESFVLVPGAPFAYWVDRCVLQRFKDLPALEGGDRCARMGMKTNDDSRFLRIWFEGELTGFHLFAKGGAYSPYYSDVHIMLNWRMNGEELRAFCLSKGFSPSRDIRSEDKYFRPGLTWPPRTQKGLGLRVMPAGCVFGHKGPTAFIDNDDPETLLALLAITNSAAFRGLVSLQMAFGSYEVGVIQRTPVPPLHTEDQKVLAETARRIWSLKHSMDQAEETSHAFLAPALVMTTGATLAERIAAWTKTLQENDAEIQCLQSEIDALCWDLYGLGEADRRALAEPGATATEDGETDEIEGEEDSTTSASPGDLAADLASWLFGAALGRWDWGLATGDTLIPPLPGPFDPLPRVSRGMVKGSDGLHPARYENGRLWPLHDLLVDDDGASLDLVHRALEVLEKVVGTEHIDAYAQELEQMLGSDLRTWFRSSFFERHLKRYSKSRRKAPIYWQLGTPSASYSVWLYYPRLTRDSLYRVLNEVVKPKVTHEEQRLTEMRGEGATRRQIEIQEGFVEELRTFWEEVTRVAPLWNPDLDDGVLLNFAPLWRLTPHPGWRRDTKTAWDALAKGDFDWAKLAMKLWPERVIPKCARERHLALAHDLEAALQTTPVEELVRVGTSPAVKDALQNLLTAPALGGSARAPRAASPRRATPSGEPAPAPAPQSRGTVSEETLAAIKGALVLCPQGAAKADVLEATNLTDAAWNTAIQALLERGEVERRGEKRGARYFLKTVER